VAIKTRQKIRHSEPLEGEDARRLVEDVEQPEGSDEQRTFLQQSKGLFAKLFSDKPASSFFGK
jgi:hypothetical protein